MAVEHKHLDPNKGKVQNVDIDSGEPSVIKTSTAQTDPAKVQVIDGPEGKTLKAVAALPIIMRQGLNILYAKNQNELTSISLENHGKEGEHVYCLIGSEASAQDVYHITQLGSSAKAEGRTAHVLIITNGLGKESEYVSVIKTLAEKTGLQVHTSLTTMLQGEENVSL